MAYTKKASKRRKTTRATKVSLPRVKRILQNALERKFVNNTELVTNPAGGYASYVPATWTFISALAGLAQGSGASNRVGNRIFLRCIRFTIECSPLADTAKTGAYCRMVIYHNKEAVGALPTATAVFSINEVQSARNLTLTKRYRILKDVTHHMVVTGNNATTVIASGPVQLMTLVCYPKKQIDFQSNAATISDLFKDDFGIAFCANYASNCQLKIQTQIEFSDV